MIFPLFPLPHSAGTRPARLTLHLSLAFRRPRIRYFTFLDECRKPKACTILLRGPSKDILSEIDRNLADAMAVARNVVFNPLLAPGGGATELAISAALGREARALEGAEAEGLRAIAEAMEVIPRTLIQNCGGNAMRVLTDLRVRFRPLRSLARPPDPPPARSSSSIASLLARS